MKTDQGEWLDLLFLLRQNLLNFPQVEKLGGGLELMGRLRLEIVPGLLKLECMASSEIFHLLHCLGL